MLNSARRTDEMCGAADGIRHGAAAVRRNTVSAAYIRCRSSKQQTTVAARCQDHGSTARLTCGAVSKLTLSRETGHSSCGTSPESAQTAGFCCREAHLGYLSDNYTSEKGCLSIPQTQNIPVRGFRGAFFVPDARAGRGRYTRQRSAYRNKRKRAAADMPHRGVEKVYAPNAPGCAKIRFPYHKHRTRRIGGTKFHPRKRGYNICEQPRFSR